MYISVNLEFGLMLHAHAEYHVAHATSCNVIQDGTNSFEV
jgi:hypothetical protein